MLLCWGIGGPRKPAHKLSRSGALSSLLFGTCAQSLWLSLGSNTLRLTLVAARVALYPVRGAWWVVNLPFRGLAYAFTRFQLKERYQAVFFSEDLTRGLVPTVSFQSGLGATGGLSFRWNDIEGSGTTLKLKAAYGGEFLQS